jgi:hypothetical protein
MAEFIFKKRIGRRSRKDNNSINNTPIPKKPVFISVFQNETNGKFFELTDIQIHMHKRNNIIHLFNRTYENKDKYTLLEFGIPFIVSESVSPIIQKIKRGCSAMGNELLGFVWVYDVGEENFGQHYHLVVAIKAIKKYKYPDQLKIKYKNKAIHGDFVRNNLAFENYLKGKDLYERGYKKRLFGKSLKFNTIKTINKNNNKNHL